jgi:predicted dienelactone hydrolase
LTVANPTGDGAIQTFVWYPTTAPASLVKLGPFDLEVAIGSASEAGAHPLIVISHGTGGSNLGHHDTAMHLARHGFVVATPMHPGDNFQDTSAYGTDVQLFGRPRHVKAVLDAVVAHPVFGRIVDTARIGVAGMSAGGYTALVLVGGKPDFTKLATYCREQPDDPWICGRGYKNGGPPALSDWALVRDPRIKSAVLMAPALGPAFDRAGLADVHVPIRLYRPEADEVLRHPYNAEHVRMMLPRAPEYVGLPNAGHYVFLAPCSPGFARQAPQICVDPPGVDRGLIHARLNAEIEDFFRRTLR